MAEKDKIDSAMAGLSPERKRPLPSSARRQRQQDDGAGSLRLQRRGPLLEARVRRLAGGEQTYPNVAGLHDQGIALARDPALAGVEKSDPVRVVRAELSAERQIARTDGAGRGFEERLSLRDGPRLELVLRGDGTRPLYCRFEQQISGIDVDEAGHLAPELVHERHGAGESASLVGRAPARNQLTRDARGEDQRR